MTMIISVDTEFGQAIQKNINQILGTMKNIADPAEILQEIDSAMTHIMNRMLEEKNQLIAQQNLEILMATVYVVIREHYKAKEATVTSELFERTGTIH